MAGCILACQALSEEVRHILAEQDLHIPVELLPAELDMFPSKLRRVLEAKLGSSAGQFDLVVLAYGRCCPLMNDLVSKHRAHRIQGDSCYEILGGTEIAQRMDDGAGAYYLTPFLCRTFERVTAISFSDREQMKSRLSKRSQLVYLDTGMDDTLVDKARDIAQTIGIPIEIYPAGLTHLRAALFEALLRAGLKNARKRKVKCV